MLQFYININVIIVSVINVEETKLVTSSPGAGFNLPTLAGGLLRLRYDVEGRMVGGLWIGKDMGGSGCKLTD